MLVFGLTGAAIVTAVCLVYLVRPSAPGRRDRSGIAGFTFLGA
ncbi:hypothetical protein [Amycolatopsis taiwanensis]|nr:hypothetical protein [Amycolatopsis taiwanensis]